ncbi:MAG: peptide ABC transporter substrate-binding protein [Cellvibrionaceae bacterium]|nr:peptide ABC transporter substrate-binding protein [Cellvibrionaceae bacterium]
MKSLFFIVTIASILLSSACSENSQTPVELGNREGIYHVGNLDEPSDIDPHITTGLPEYLIQMALFEGLVSKHPETLATVPGVAERWDISQDQKTYTFHLRKDAKWSDGKAITAEDFLWSWRRALLPALGNQYAYSFYIIKNAEAFYKGDIDDFAKVGVEALDPHTLKVELANPASYFLQLLDHHSMYPVPRHVVEKWGKADERGTRWTRPENFVGNGAFTLYEWMPNQVLKVKRNPHYWDAATVKLNEVNFYPVQQTATEERMFRSGQLHRTENVPLDKVAGYLEKNDPNFNIDPYYGSYFYRLNTTYGPLKDKRVRQALAYSIDRKQITEFVSKSGETPSFALTPPQRNGYQPRARQLFDIEKAKALLAEAGYPNGEGLEPLELLYNTHEAHKKIAVAIQQMWKQNLGIDVKLLNQDWKVFLDSQRNLNYQVCRGSWIGDYLDPSTFLDLFTSYSGNNNTGWENTEYDALVRRATSAKTEAERFELFNQAEAVLLEEAPFIAIYTYTKKYLLSPSVKGITPNIMDYHPYKYISLESQPEQ